MDYLDSRIALALLPGPLLEVPIIRITIYRGLSCGAYVGNTARMSFPETDYGPLKWTEYSFGDIIEKIPIYPMFSLLKGDYSTSEAGAFCILQSALFEFGYYMAPE